MLTKPKKISNSAGVYIFRKGKTQLYIGKAANLKLRLASYFRNQSALPFKIQKMLHEATRLEIIKTSSEIEALIKEAELIKKHRPRYNTVMRDDKNYFFIGITKEPFPRIFTTHQPYRDRKVKLNFSGARYVGPFTSVTEVKTVLKLLRRTFPYCTCKGTHKRQCLNSQIGKCPGYCCTARFKIQDLTFKKARREYQRNIRNIAAVLSGKKTRLVSTLRRRLEKAAKAERYEDAARLRDEIRGLDSVFSHQGVLRAPQTSALWSETRPNLRSLFKTQKYISRIEGYDISNISGQEATGSMVVFMNGAPDKSQYRKFRIRMPAPPGGGNDVAMLKEVLRRRFGHPEWPYPELIVVYGGQPQLGAALWALRESSLRPELRPRGIKNLESKKPIVTALAKREEILFLEDRRAIPLRKQDHAILHFFQRIRDESHRFARAYHHKLRTKHYAEA